jgi:hypothetical protein
LLTQLAKMGFQASVAFEKLPGRSSERSPVSNLQRSDYWMGHANGEMAGRYGKQLLE